jgi:hypothetical protein
MICAASASNCSRYYFAMADLHGRPDHWTLAHRRWLASQSFGHVAQQIVFQDGINAIEDARQRLLS